MRMLLIGLLIGLALGAIGAGFFLQNRAHWLAHYHFQLFPPHVPQAVLETVRNAEATAYADVPAWRRAVEGAQDMLAFASPATAYRFNFSLGPYRVKAKTIEEILPWTIEKGYLEVSDENRSFAHHAISYFSEQPAMSDWQAAVLLEWLRRDHPELIEMSWEQIAADPALVAKLYSGYMGAGGAWDAWRADLTPGPEARRRLGLN